jgi:hypothetical protein
MNITRAFLTAVVLAAVGGTAARADERQAVPKEPATSAQATTHEGTLVRAKGDKVVVRIREAKAADAQEQTFTLAPNARVTRGDRQLGIGDLRPGMRVRVTVAAAGSTASRVEVLDKGR